MEISSIPHKMQVFFFLCWITDNQLLNWTVAIRSENVLTEAAQRTGHMQHSAFLPACRTQV